MFYQDHLALYKYNKKINNVFSFSISQAIFLWFKLDLFKKKKKKKKIKSNKKLLTRTIEIKNKLTFRSKQQIGEENYIR